MCFVRVQRYDVLRILPRKYLKNSLLEHFLCSIWYKNQKLSIYLRVEIKYLIIQNATEYHFGILMSNVHMNRKKINPIV